VRANLLPASQSPLPRSCSFAAGSSVAPCASTAGHNRPAVDNQKIG
jgi:hypothetical protein